MGYSITNKLVLSALLATGISCAPALPPLQNVGQARASFTQDVPEYQYREDIKLTEEVRSFAEGHLGLSKSQHYRNFRKTAPRTYCQLNVTQKNVLLRGFSNAFEITEDYQFRREVPSHVILVSTEDSLADEEEYYSKNHDVFRRCITDFHSPSTVSYLTPEFFQRSKVEQVQVIVEENCHSTLSEEIRFSIPLEQNEAICSIISYAGTVDFFKQRRREFPEEYKEAVASFENRKKWAQTINYYHDELSKIYRLRLNWDYTQQIRKNILAEARESLGNEINNASLWHFSTYTNKFPEMEGIYHSQQGDLKATMAAFVTQKQEASIDLPSFAKDWRKHEPKRQKELKKRREARRKTRKKEREAERKYQIKRQRRTRNIMEDIRAKDSAWRRIRKKYGY